MCVEFRVQLRLETHIAITSPNVAGQGFFSPWVPVVWLGFQHVGGMQRQQAKDLGDL